MLKMLQQVTQAVNDNFSRSQLMRIYENILRQLPSIRGVALFSQENNSLKCEFSDWNIFKPESGFSVHNYLEQLGDLQYPHTLEGTSLPFNVVIPSYHKEKTLGFLLVQLAPVSDEPSDNGEWLELQTEFLQTLNNIVFVALENKKLAREAIRQEALRKEVELASELQSWLFPQENEDLPGLLVSGTHKTYEEVGGDYYDFFALPDGDVALCIADVSGKGMSAALLMANFQANVRALFPFLPDLAQLGHTLNKKVDQAARGEKFITCFLARFDPRNRKLHYVNLGHNPPFFLHQGQLRQLDATAPALGMIPELPSFSTTTCDVATDDILLAYTDGVTELQNDENQFFGSDRLMNILLENTLLTPSEINAIVAMQLNTFRGNSPFRDDFALLTCKFF
ncbi:MAG: serine/threonine-protein phosphatase [Flavobacteriales bacterium]|nr:serine/threonine-protein phosphatase [Flavobacteriales bacterium]MCX7767652.1 serine/threonine-protein phosphatase [Flavobacteriales bacterium]MDW8409506.1 PP2C family protein-serine/threonine phosphatase [Flavobacteriales bacterium]